MMKTYAVILLVACFVAVSLAAPRRGPPPSGGGGQPGGGPPEGEGCEPPPEIKEKVESAIREILGDRTDALIQAMKDREEEYWDASFREVLRAQEGITRGEIWKVSRAVHEILKERWVCDDEEEGDGQPGGGPPGGGPPGGGPPKGEGCEPPPEIKEKFESAIREILGDRTDALIQAIKDRAEEYGHVSFQKVLRAQEGITRREKREVSRAVRDILREGWDCIDEEEDDGYFDEDEEDL